MATRAEESENKESRRSRGRRFFINRAFQLRMMRRAGIPLTLITVTVAAAIYFFTGGGNNYSADQLRLAGYVGLALLFAFSWLGIYWSLWLYSSRIAGPLINLRHTLQEVAEGDLRVRMQTRKKDELKEQADHLNHTIISLQDRVKRINQFCAYTLNTIDEMREQNPDLGHLDKLRELTMSIQESVEDFKV